MRELPVYSIWSAIISALMVAGVAMLDAVAGIP